MGCACPLENVFTLADGDGELIVGKCIKLSIIDKVARITN